MWRVDDLKISHTDGVITDVIKELSERYGVHSDLTVERGNISFAMKIVDTLGTSNAIEKTNGCHYFSGGQ